MDRVQPQFGSVTQGSSWASGWLCLCCGWLVGLRCPVMATNYGKFDKIGKDEEGERAPAAPDKSGSEAVQELLTLGKDASMADLMAKMKALPASAKQHFLDKLGPDVMEAATKWNQQSPASRAPAAAVMPPTKEPGPASAKAAKQAVPEPRPSETSAKLVGCSVTIAGLTARPELNGKHGVCASFHTAKGRYAVKIDGFSEPMLLKPDNLTENEGTPLEDVD